MTQETIPTQAEIEPQEKNTSEFRRPSKTRKALTSILGGLGIFAATNVFGAIGGMHNDQVRDARAQKARLFDLNTAELIPVIHVNENGEEIDEEGVPVAVNKTNE